MNYFFNTNLTDDSSPFFYTFYTFYTLLYPSIPFSPHSLKHPMGTT